MVNFLRNMIHHSTIAISKQLIKMMPQNKPVLLLGKGASLELCTAISQLGVKKLLIVTDATLIDLNLHRAIVDQLEKYGIETIIYDGVEPDPSYHHVNDGLTLLKQYQCDAILALGGGSPIDTAKIISACASNNKPVEKLIGLFKVRKPCMPLFVIPTTAGTGSEATVAAVVSDPKTHMKKQIIDTKLIPTMAALDPELMIALPPPITAATGIDALTHAIEAYISVNATLETNQYAITAVKLIFDNLPKAYKNGDDIHARQAMALASHYAGLAFSKASLGYVHAIAHNLGASYQTPHGLANAIVLPLVLDFSKKASVSQLATLAAAIRDTDPHQPEHVLAQQFIDDVRLLKRTLGLPEKLDALEEKDISSIAQQAIQEAYCHYPAPKLMNIKQCESILRSLTPS